MEHLPSALQKSCKSSSAPHPVVFSPASAMQELCGSGGVCVLNYGERKRELFSVSKTEKSCLFFFFLKKKIAFSCVMKPL